MHGRVIGIVLTSVALYLAGATPAPTQEALDLNGAFVGAGLPTGWGPNQPGYWDEAGTVTLTHIPDLEKSAVRLTSVAKAMSLYTSARQFAVSVGDKVVVKSLMRGAGAGSLGVYYYPGGGWLKKEFPVTTDWTEFAAELAIPEKVTHVRVVIGIPPCASAEFLDLRAQVIRTGR